MTTDIFRSAPEPEKHLARSSLLDALLARRSRRFGKGMRLNGGPLAYESAHEPEPLSPVEEATLAWRCPHWSRRRANTAGRTCTRRAASALLTNVWMFPASLHLCPLSISGRPMCVGGPTSSPSPHSAASFSL